MAQPKPAAEILIAERYGWQRHISDGITLYFKGHVQDGDPQRLISGGYAAARGGEDAAAAWLSALDGHFAIVIQGPEASLAAVDRVRSIPLLYSTAGEVTLFSELAEPIVERLSLTAADADPLAVLATAMSGFTIGNDTVFKAIRQIGPGEFVLSGSAEGATGARVARYHRWTLWKPADRVSSDLADRLSALNTRIIQKLIAGLDGRRVLVPLSAGLDSRFVAAGLKAAGYDNVVCFSYGQPGNHEAATAREIAARLGFDWHFVPYSIDKQRRSMTSAGYAAFEAMSDSLTGVHFPQEYLAFEQLLAAGVADERSVVVNGQAGDFISGNHIPADFHEAIGPGVDRRTRILDALMAKHYRLWRSLMTPENNALIRTRLNMEIDRLGGLPGDADQDYGVFEYCEFQDRQSKYVLNGQRHYEFFSMDWRLPLWDRDYMDFWAAAPLSAKRRQSLYRDVLARDNWAGVWRDIPVNAKTVRPAWIRPVRWIAKALHAPLGRDRWHDFERRYLQYWMATTCTYGKWPWRQVARDGRGHWNQIALHVADYLAAKGWLFGDTVGPRTP